MANFRHRNAGHFAQERDRPARARVHFDDVDDAFTDDELDVHQANGVQPLRHADRVVFDCLDQFRATGFAAGKQRSSRPSGRRRVRYVP